MRAHPVVHMELHTSNLAQACAFYSQLCGWRPQRIEEGNGSYLALELGGAIGGGFGLVGAVEGMLVAGVVNALTTRTQIDTYIRLTGATSQAILHTAEHTPRAIVVDNKMPGGDGIDMLVDLRRTCPDARIVMHTSEDTIDLRARAVQLGADAIVPKGRPLDELAALIDCA